MEQDQRENDPPCAQRSLAAVRRQPALDLPRRAVWQVICGAMSPIDRHQEQRQRECLERLVERLTDKQFATRLVVRGPS